MIIKMLETRVMPFGIFADGESYNSETDINLSEGQAKTFVMCGAAQDVIPSGVQLAKKTVKKVDI